MTEQTRSTLETILEAISKTAPPILTRTEIEKITGGAIKAKSLANMDSLGEDGIPERFTIGRKVCYPTPAFINWLRTRSKIVTPSKEVH
ncbi:MAG: hypothetical protein JRG71_01015 [Deltaproteobacteria bacterium]|nr:hypothetical protein [Deltaproteobacteria bacterium]